MQLPNKKSRLQRMGKTLKGSLDLSGKSKLSLPKMSTGSGVSRDQALKAGLVAGGLAGLTAVSAGISSARRAGQGSDDS